MDENMKLWDSVKKTDPQYTKKVKVGGLPITAIAPQYQIMLATKQFGPYGKGFGFKSISMDYSLVPEFKMVVFKGVFFFPGGEFEIINSSKLHMDRAQKMVDADFAKKIETDALTKALSKLGFNADVFMGLYDDHKYVDEMRGEFAPVDPEVDLIKEAVKNNDIDFVRREWHGIIAKHWVALDNKLINTLNNMIENGG